jgi:hypothetical protein
MATPRKRTPAEATADSVVGTAAMLWDWLTAPREDSEPEHDSEDFDLFDDDDDDDDDDEFIDTEGEGSE